MSRHTVKLRENRKTERDGVNAARTLFEGCGYVFQEIDLGNDYGKDAYVDLVEGQSLTGVCVALQIKSGKSYKRSSGYSIPLGEHTQVWGGSTVPIAGIVLDPDKKMLFWCSISQFLAENPTLSSEIPVINRLTAETLESGFKPHFRDLSQKKTAGPAILQLCSDEESLRRDALLDCFALGRSDARIFILLRHVLGMQSGKSLRIALRMLAHVTPHPDILWHDGNWVPEETCAIVKPHLVWTRDEIKRFLSEIAWEEWQRGDTGEDLYLLLHEDPAIKKKMEDVAIEAVREGNEEAAWPAWYLSIYWAGYKGREKYEQLVQIAPEFEGLPLAAEVRYCLGESECVTLFD